MCPCWVCADCCRLTTSGLGCLRFALALWNVIHSKPQTCFSFSALGWCLLPAPVPRSRLPRIQVKLLDRIEFLSHCIPASVSPRSVGVSRMRPAPGLGCPASREAVGQGLSTLKSYTCFQFCAFGRCLSLAARCKFRLPAHQMRCPTL